jgi:hypothetical protein
MIEISQQFEGLPKYKCHKVVGAAKITSMKLYENGDCLLVFGEINKTLTVDKFWMAKFAPATGGYYVVYKDRYASFSPADAFEDGYALTTESWDPGEGK